MPSSGASSATVRLERGADVPGTSGMITANATGAASTAAFSTAHLTTGDALILKVQRALGSDAPPLLVYDEGRRFSVLIKPHDAPWEALNTAVAAFAPTAGAKAFFSALLESDDALLVSLAPLALQPW